MVSYPLLPKDAGCKCFFLMVNLHGEVKLEIDENFILQTLSCKLEFTKHVNYILQGVISFYMCCKFSTFPVKEIP